MTTDVMCVMDRPGAARLGNVHGLCVKPAAAVAATSNEDGREPCADNRARPQRRPRFLASRPFYDRAPPSGGSTKRLAHSITRQVYPAEDDFKLHCRGA